MDSLSLVGTLLFALAVVHVFSVGYFAKLAHRHPEGSLKENLFHLLAEVEVVFGLWAGILVVGMVLLLGPAEAVQRVEALNFTEPAFVFVIMTVAATRPVIEFASSLIDTASRFLPLERNTAFYVTALTLGPLLGSFITEPAAMTVTALLLKDRIFDRTDSQRLKYVTLAVLFVNISVGGVLTPYAAPPVLMVAAKWNWDLTFMLTHFGPKATLAVVANAALATLLSGRELRALTASAPSPGRSPLWMVAVHLAFMGLVVVCAHHPVIFLGLFLFFLGFTAITQEYQAPLKLRESLLVGYFLGGLVVLGAFQRWWLEPILTQLPALPLFLGTAGLTAFLDNAALTYLGAQVPDLAAPLRYALVAGAVGGGGLTVIANAPNPAGYAILQKSFGPGGIEAPKLLFHALPPTLIALMALWALG